MKQYSVMVTYDNKLSVLRESFDDFESAMDYMKSDSRDEHEDNLADGFDSEYVLYEDEGRAIVTTHWQDHDDIIEWQVGEIDEVEEQK